LIENVELSGITDHYLHYGYH